MGDRWVNTTNFTRLPWFVVNDTFEAIQGYRYLKYRSVHILSSNVAWVKTCMLPHFVFFLCPVCPGVGEVLYKLLCWTSQRWTIFFVVLSPPYPTPLTPWPWHLGPLKEKKKSFYSLIQAKVTRLVCRSSFAIEDIGWVGLSRALVFLDCGFRGPETHFWNFVFLLLCLFVVVCLLCCLWFLVFWLSFDDFFKINLVMDWP